MKIWNQLTGLAKLKLTQKEEELLIPQVQNIISFFEKISEIPTDQVQPLISPSENFSAFRSDDLAKEDASSASFLIQQAPLKEGHFVKTALVVPPSEE